MNTLFKNKMLTGLVILLLIANITTIVMFWAGIQHKHPRPRQQAKEYLIKELSLNDVQQKQYKAMVQDHRKKAKEISMQIRENKDSLFALLADKATRDSSKNDIVTRIALLNQQLELITFDHFTQVRSILTAGQQQRFDSIIKDVLKMMAAPPETRPEGSPPGEEGHLPPKN